jgi:hypothetical protein
LETNIFSSAANFSMGVGGSVAGAAIPRGAHAGAMNHVS